MNLKRFSELNQSEIDLLVNNINTGIEYEYALFYLLTTAEEKTLFMNSVINIHPYKDRIKSLITQINIGPILSSFNACSFNPSSYYLVTQDDSVGPSDLIATNKNGDKIGLSVKYANSCQQNISGKHFLGKEDIDNIKPEFHKLCDEYIHEMTRAHGSIENWFRKRKTSTKTDEIIDLIRDAVIEKWSSKSTEEKRLLMTRLLQADSPVKYFIVTFKTRANALSTVVRTDLEYNLNYDAIILKKHQTSIISFEHNGAVLGHLQIKFNNGILEKGTDSNSFCTINGIKLRRGAPFTSWNFSLK
ncbi:hypothetical protein [Kaistella rhinocerotis]|uniref:hypothetical protein n=1 Tax=Kaistella rhinocerotis TaxID=3026437 RepID=UPI002556C60C|nr:hypothetical protein [Kaistella sp. Ran72]